MDGKEVLMKILCAYWDDEPDYLGTDPEIELAGHEIVVAHSYFETRTLIMDASSRMPPFDIVLLDIALPDVLDSSEEGIRRLPTVVLFARANINLIRGVGVFVPVQYSEVFSVSFDSYHALVADKTCWTPAGKRDWRKMF